MRRHQHDEDDVIGTKPRRDPLAGLGLFAEAQASAACDAPDDGEGASTVRRVLQGDPAANPAPFTGTIAGAASAPTPGLREVEQTDAFVGGMSDTEFNERIARIQRLVLDDLLLLALARKNIPHDGKPGITAEDARHIAHAKGLSGLLGEQQRAWSWLSAWLQTLARKGKLTKYRIAGITVKRMAENGNDQVVYLHPYDYRASGEAVA